MIKYLKSISAHQWASCLIICLTCVLVIHQVSEIRNLRTQLKSLTSESAEEISNQSRYIKRLEKSNLQLQKDAIKSNNQLKSYEVKLKKYTNKPKVSNYMSSYDSGFRSYMSYKAITMTNSPQYRVVHEASPNSYGILEMDNRAVVAIGSGWGLKVGDRGTVYTTNGSFHIVVGDMKADCHTDSSNRITLSNGCAVEFIIDNSALINQIKISGNVATISKYSGKVLNIVKSK